MEVEQTNLAKNVSLFVKGNVLAVVCDKYLSTVSSAIFNGGFKKVKAVLNIGVPEDYSDLLLHLNPIELITLSSDNFGLTKDYLAMITAAKIKNYSLFSSQSEDFSVSVVATAGCSHGESSGEEMDVQEITGTINIIVFIDGNPSESCMVAALITSTEAKTAALTDFDVRSRYTGDSATGSITDSVTVASTCHGKEISHGGPASKLGKLVGYCTRRAVTEALLKQEPKWADRTVLDRLGERHIPLEKIVTELSKVDGLVFDEVDLVSIIKNNPVMGAYLLAAAKLDEDLKKNLLLPAEFGDVFELSKFFGSCVSSTQRCSQVPSYDAVDLPPFLKHVLIQIAKNTQSKGVTEKT